MTRAQSQIPSRPLVLLALVCLGAGCGEAAKITPGVDAGPPLVLGINAVCNPLVGSDPLDCVTPWPSSTYEVAASTGTGWQLAVPLGAMPANAMNVVVDPGKLNLHDGFSPAGPIVVHFKEGVDGGNLPGWQDLSASLDPASPVQLLDTSGNRQLQFAELDATTTAPRQALFIRPMTRLQPRSTYVVVLLNTLEDGAGDPLPPNPAMQALISGQVTDNPRLEAQRPEYQQVIFPALQMAGIPLSEVLLAWDYRTGSDEQLTSHILSMRDQALTQVGDGSKVAYTITQVIGGPDAGVPDAGPPQDGGLRQVYEQLVGSYEVPLYLTADGGPTGELVLDDGGLPVEQGSYAAEFAALIPTAILTATPANPVPVTVFGHGLLGDAIEYSQNPLIQDAAERNGVLMVMTNWTGLSAEDESTVGNAVLDINNISWVTDKIQQAVINAIVLGLFAKGSLANDPLLQPHGQNVVDPDHAYYYGISLGGIMGDTFMAYDPDVINGVLNVPGGNWSLMLERSTDWQPLALIFSGAYPDGVNQAFLSAYLQPFFDYSDPITTAPYVLGNPLPGVPKKNLLMQEGRYDLQVNNLATEMTARTLGIPLVLPTDDTPYGLTPATAPVPSGLTIYDLEPSQKPNITNALNTGDNGVHDGVYPTGAAQRQVTAFLRPGGTVIQECSGTQGCICAAPANACN